MELTTLDTELIRLQHTLDELIATGLVKAVCYSEVDSTRYCPAAEAGRPGEDEQEDEVEEPARAHEVAA